MLKTYEFRLYPTKEQERILNHHLYLARLTYNEHLAFKIYTYNEDGRNLTNFELNNSLLSLKEEYPELKEVHSQVLQDVNKRVSLAFQHFFRRVKRMENPGYPRFKGKNHYHSITYPHSGFSLGDKLRETLFLS